MSNIKKVAETPTHPQKQGKSKKSGVAVLDNKHIEVLEEWYSNGNNKSRAVMKVMGSANHSAAVHVFNAIMSKPEAVRYVESMQSRARGAMMLGREQVSDEFRGWAFGDITEALGDSKEEMRLKGLPSEVRRTLQSVKVAHRVETDRKGNEVTTTTIDYKAIDKLNALKEYTKLIGGYEIDNEQRNGSRNEVPKEFIAEYISLIDKIRRHKDMEDRTIDVTPDE